MNNINWTLNSTISSFLWTTRICDDKNYHNPQIKFEINRFYAFDLLHFITQNTCSTERLVVKYETLSSKIKNISRKPRDLVILVSGQILLQKMIRYRDFINKTPLDADLVLEKLKMVCNWVHLNWSSYHNCLKW